MDKLPYLILGSSAAALGTVEGIRAADPAQAGRPITLLSREPEGCYSRPLISYLLAGKIGDEAMCYRDGDFLRRNNVSALLGVAARRIDADRRTVETSDGRSLPFDKLLIATGGKPIVPAGLQLPQAPEAGVFTFTTWGDARRIAAFIRANSVQEAVIVGGGLIGLKALEALLALNISTTLVELAERILSATFDRAASDLVRSHLEKAGVHIRCATTLARIEQREGKVVEVVLRHGTRVPCRLVILAVGVAPETDVCRGSPIRLDRGILVDEHMETSAPGIYAAGDCAQAADLLTGEKRLLPIFPNAFRQGLVAGSNMAGKERLFGGGLAMNAVTFLGLPTISVGITSPDGDGCQTLQALDPDKPSYKKLVLKDDRIIGAIFIGPIDRAGIITGLIREKVNVAPFKELLLTEDFGLLSLPSEYRKHLVSGINVAI